MYSTIRTELDQLLNTHATSAGVPVAWPNVDFDPTLPNPWFRANLLPAESGDYFYDDTLDYTGIYQVDVNVAKNGLGTVELRNLVDGLLTAFKRNTKTANLIIEKSWAAPEQVGDAWITVPVSIRYRGFE